MIASEAEAVRLAMGRAWILVAGTLAIALIGTSVAFADESRPVDCTVRFQLSGWSASYERVDGTGIVACEDGTWIPVDVQASGLGLLAAKSNVTSGTGKFSPVHQISDVFGTYAESHLHAVVGNSGSAPLLNNGKVSLELAGTDEGHDLGRGVAGFTIRPE